MGGPSNVHLGPDLDDVPRKAGVASLGGWIHHSPAAGMPRRTGNEIEEASLACGVRGCGIRVATKDERG